MADKDDNDLHSSSLSGHDSDDNSDNGKNDGNIPSIPPPESPANGEDNSAAIEKFLEQVVAANNADAKANGEASKGKDREKELKFAKRLVIPPECKCQLNNGEPCHTRFSVRELMDTRSHYMSISKKELDIAVLAKLECGIHLTKMTTRKKRRPTERKKHRTDFYHHGYRICNLMFVYLHGFSYKKLKALIMQYKTNGVKTRIHKNLKPKPPEAEVKVKKKKHKPKPKPKEPTLPKPKKQRVTKSKQGKTAGSGRGAKKDIQITQQHHHSILPKPPQALPHPPLHSSPLLPTCQCVGVLPCDVMCRLQKWDSSSVIQPCVVRLVVCLPSFVDEDDLERERERERESCVCVIRPPIAHRFDRS